MTRVLPDVAAQRCPTAQKLQQANVQSFQLDCFINGFIITDLGYCEKAKRIMDLDVPL